MRMMSTIVLTAMLGLFAAAPLAAQEPPTQAAPAVALVNLNTATAAQLQTLPGVGPALAMRIIEYRESNGRFARIEDVMNVRGVGETTFLRMRDLLTVTPPDTQAAERR